MKLGDGKSDKFFDEKKIGSGGFGKEYERGAFGKTIKQLRKDLNFTQKQFAGLFGVHQTTVSEWEQNRMEASYAVLCKISAYFGVPVGFLLGVEE